MQAQESWANATTLMESVAGVQLSKKKTEPDSNLMLKSEVESLWQVIQDQNSELKTHKVPPPRRPRNFPVQDTAGGPRAPEAPGSGFGLASRVQKIRQEAEDLHSEVGRWRAGYGAPMAMNNVRERRGAPPITRINSY